MPFERLDIIQERVNCLIREVVNLREENEQLQARISNLQRKLKDNKRRLEHALISEDELRKLRIERQQVQERVSYMLNQLKDI
jgi:uncharacterized coiled-coil DUF342 family protein